MTSQVGAIRNLVRQLHEAKEESKSSRVQCERLEKSLELAKSRLSQLNRSAGSQDPYFFDDKRGIITPGVSRKVLEALVREITRLKQALNHVTKKENGVDLAVENKHLHDVITTLKDQKELKSKEVEEMKQLLGTVESRDTRGLEDQVVRLTEEVNALETKLVANETFLATVVGDNENLVKAMQSINHDSAVKRDYVMKGPGGALKMQDQTRDKDDTPDDVKRLIEELQSGKGDKECMQGELAVSKEVAQTDHALVENLHRQVKELQDAHELVTKERDELQAERQLMQSALVGYEGDFKIEREEKLKALDRRRKLEAQLKEATGRYERLHKEYACHRQNVPERYPSGRTNRIHDVPVAPSVTRGNELQCPDCNKTFPCRLLEEHMRSCGE